MRIAVHGRLRYAKDMDRLLGVLGQLEGLFTEVTLCPGLATALERKDRLQGRTVAPDDRLTAGSYDMLVSIGGDGTILEAARMVRDSGIPILGINNGRLGFLSSTPLEETEQALARVIAGEYVVEQRSLIELRSVDNPFEDRNFALNELTVHKSNRSSMIVIHAYIDGAFLNTYWADGLIISTPTGSTGYSLSAGGPIVAPTSQSIIISPIAPHNLNVRPLVVPDGHCITLEVEGRASDHLVSLDSVSHTLRPGTRLEICKANFSVGLVRFSAEDYFNTLRSKLMWGIDRRN
ncbi:MAG: NAD kinase [Flavobacteriales bacterium]|nr:NAD kinase [Flavobacteriales bacterium]